MRSRRTIRVGLAVLSVTTVIVVATLKARTNQDQVRTNGRGLPTVVAKQMPSINGVIPVEIQGGQANFSAPNEVGNFSCTVKNNTNKNITALSLAYTIRTERDGEEGSDTSFLTLESFVHRDVQEASNLRPIAPGDEYVFQSRGVTGFENAFIKGIEARIDYVEFEDKTSLGPNERGAQIISLIREGAIKYKEWLARKYVQQGRSVTVLVPLLQAHDIPNDLHFNNTHQLEGARIYQRHMLSVYKNRGALELEKLISR